MDSPKECSRRLLAAVAQRKRIPVTFTPAFIPYVDFTGNLAVYESVPGRDDPTSNLSAVPALRPPSPPTHVNVTVVSPSSLGVYWSPPVYDGG